MVSLNLEDRWTNEQRRTMASLLRCTANEPEPDARRLGVAVGLCALIGVGASDWRKACVALANLVDRPLCEIHYCKAENDGSIGMETGKDNAAYAQCGNCGRTYDNLLDWSGEQAFRYCPNCGAEVKR